MEITGQTYSTTHYEEFRKEMNTNYFEEVVDLMILDGIEGMNESFRNAIMSLDRDKKRMTILSLLDKDLNLFKRIKALTDKNINKMDHIKDIILMLREYVKVGEVEKKKFGEVMTPLELVKEMLATLPEEVWSNPNLKWLDPANGTGPYPIMVIYKLMKGLEEWEPDSEKRYKHIVENMIYVCELQPKNMFLYMCAIDPFDAYKLNIYTGSFLEKGFDFHMKEVWGLDKFDIVVGNPPYNENNSNNNNKIYFKFIKKSYILLKENSPLCYVLPDDSISYIVNEEKYQLNYVNSNDIVGRYFKGIGTKILYFLSIKKQNFEKTKFIDTKSETYIDLTKLSTILMDIEDTLLIDKISKYSNQRFEYKNAKYNNNNYRIRFNGIAKDKFSLRDINLVCVDEKLLKKHGLLEEDFDRNIFKYKVIDHSSDRIEFYSDKNFDNDKKRVCVNTIGEIKPIFDSNGEYLLTDSFVYIEVENDIQAQNLIDILNSKLCKYLQRVITHNTKSKYKIMNYLPKLNLSKKWSDNELYNEFKLNSFEIEKVEKY
jgi:site-specific DNA-methyltransferase (adenine-specific)